MSALSDNCHIRFTFIYFMYGLLHNALHVYQLFEHKKITLMCPLVSWVFPTINTSMFTEVQCALYLFSCEQILCWFVRIFWYPQPDVLQNFYGSQKNMHYGLSTNVFLLYILFDQSVQCVALSSAVNKGISHFVLVIQ